MQTGTPNSALTAQRYRIRRRIFDTLLKRRIYHRFGASQFSGMILICFLGERSPPRSSEVDLRADERSTSRETGFRPACRTTERPRQKQVGQAPSGNRGAARQRVPPEVHREALQFFACQPRKLAEEARIQETEAVKSYGGFGTFEPLGPMSDCRLISFSGKRSRTVRIPKTLKITWNSFRTASLWCLLTEDLPIQRSRP